MKDATAVVLVLALAAVPLFAQSSLATQEGKSSYPVEIDGNKYNVYYSIVGGSVDSIIVTNNTATATVNIRSFDDGVLRIYMPGSLLYHTNISTYTDLIVFVDELEVSPKVVKQGCDVELEIPFESGSEQIDIVGTFLAGPSSAEHSVFGRVSVDGKDYDLNVITNADSCNFAFDIEEKKLSAELDGPVNEEGYFAITLRHDFLGGPYNVLVDSQPVEFDSIFYEGGQATTISFQYEGKDMSRIDIVGTTAIPEFPAVIIIAAISVLATALLVRFVGPQKVL